VSDFLPFSAVVGQDDAKLALILAACEPRLGGVLLRGDKGSAKSTLARGLASLLPGEAPFVDLPVGATEDRVVGTLDLAAALTGGEKRFEPGLLHAADGGVLYVDEINLLPDHLVDVLLDVAASGVNRVEREGVSHTHSSRFVLIGSMNPEEGDLRPQLLDRFGLAVDVLTPVGAGDRAAALRRRLDFDRDPVRVTGSWADSEHEIAARLAACRPATVPEAVLDAVASLCAAAGAQGLRADLSICRAAAALAGWEGRAEADLADVRRVAPMALAHRARRDPLDPPGQDRQRLEEAMAEHLGPPDGGDAGDPGDGAGEGPEGGGDPEERHDPGPVTASALPDDAVRRHLAATGRRSPAAGPRGRLVGDRTPDGPVGSVAVGATVRRAAARRGTDPGGPLVEAADVREAVREHKAASLVVIAVDGSGSMGAARRMEMAKGAVIGLLRDAYQRRDLVALVSFRGEGAEVLLRPTGSVEVARARLAELPTGGRTPLGAGLRAALALATAPGRSATHRPVLVVITDGRATAGGDDPVAVSTRAADEVRRAGVTAVVIDVEGAGDGGPRLGLAAELAAAMGALHVPATELVPAAVEDAVRRAVLR
jgi:magnesium chelatase subunit D